MSNRMKLKDENKRKREKRKEQQKALSNNPKLNSSMNEAFSKLNITDSRMQQSMFQMIKYISVFGIGFLIDLVSYFVLYKFVGVSPLLANVFSVLLLSIYTLYGSMKNHLFQNHKFLILFVGIFFVFSEILIYLFVHSMNWNALLVKFLSIILFILGYYFLLYFRGQKKKK